MKTSSAKGKGRRLQKEVANKLYAHYALEYHDEIGIDDFKPAIMGETGVDIKMSTKGKLVCPFDIECKNVESLNIWAALSQAEANGVPSRIPLLVFKRNHSQTYCAMKLEDLFKLLRHS